jgi:hypothetical protein
MLRKVYHPGFWRLPPWSLFHIDRDPYEQHDCLSAYPTIFAELRNRLEEWERAQGPREADPMVNLAVEGPFSYSKQLVTLDLFAKDHLPSTV